MIKNKIFNILKNTIILLCILFLIFEVYKNSAALDFHRNTSYYKNYRSKVVNLLDRPIEVKVLNSIDSI